MCTNTFGYGCNVDSFTFLHRPIHVSATYMHFINLSMQVVYEANIVLPCESVTIPDHTKKGKLGEGSFAKVYKGEYGGKHCAVKVLKEDVLKKDTADKLRVVKHVNIVQIYGVWYDHHKNTVAASIVMELCDESLCEAINKRKKPSQYAKENLLLLSDITKGMMCLHSLSIIHGNLHSGNVLLCCSEGKTVAKLADFDMNRFCDPSIRSHLPTKHSDENFYPPEMLHHKDTNKKCSLTSKVDIFCFGELALEMARGSYPTPDKYKGHQSTEVQRRHKHLAKLGAYDKENLSSIIEECLSDTPEDRPEFTGILSVIERRLSGYGEQRDCAGLPGKTVSNLHLFSRTHAHQNCMFMYYYM